ncbi:hypothetical protein [Limnospira platensis]|uniref:hypothetical protein n=1 Tax=Limnospira platensis TaxID=118562 RepID=UPI0002804205|nr:hypothetical protein SPLC1_S270370 [Arthrospira platensis C1]
METQWRRATRLKSDRPTSKTSQLTHPRQFKKQLTVGKSDRLSAHSALSTAIF